MKSIYESDGSNVSRMKTARTSWASTALCLAEVLKTSQRTEHMEASYRESVSLTSGLSTLLSQLPCKLPQFPHCSVARGHPDMDPHLSSYYIFGTSSLIIRHSLQDLEKSSGVGSWLP